MEVITQVWTKDYKICAGCLQDREGELQYSLDRWTEERDDERWNSFQDLGRLQKDPSWVQEVERLSDIRCGDGLYLENKMGERCSSYS